MRDPVRPLIRNAQRFLDGLGWRPFSHEHDDDGARLRALGELFPKEAREAGLL